MCPTLHVLHQIPQQWPVVDIYGHLHGDEDISVVPYDLEVSHHELAYIVRKAKQVCDVEGESYIVAVYDYI